MLFKTGILWYIKGHSNEIDLQEMVSMCKKHYVAAIKLLIALTVASRIYGADLMFLDKNHNRDVRYAHQLAITIKNNHQKNVMLATLLSGKTSCYNKLR